MKKKNMYLIVVSIMGFLIFMLLLMGVQKADENPYRNIKSISYENALNEGGEYYLYVYLIGCPDCEKAEPYILEFAKNANLYVLNVKDATNRTKYNWEQHHELNDIEIGTTDENGTITYYEGESEEKYLNSLNIDTFGHKMRYEIEIADENYVESNSKAEIGKVYASLQTPIIDYSNIEDVNHINIPAMPIMFHIKSGTILEYYFDAPEIIDFLTKYESFVEPAGCKRA